MHKARSHQGWKPTFAFMEEKPLYRYKLCEWHKLTYRINNIIFKNDFLNLLKTFLMTFQKLMSSSKINKTLKKYVREEIRIWGVLKRSAGDSDTVHPRRHLAYHICPAHGRRVLVLSWDVLTPASSPKAFAERTGLLTEWKVRQAPVPGRPPTQPHECTDTEEPQSRVTRGQTPRTTTVTSLAV